jgi:uncharacterized membrane protein
MPSVISRALCTTTLISCLAGVCVAGQTAQFIPLWHQFDRSRAWGVSPDGSTVVGTTDNALRAFYWTESTGLQHLPSAGSSSSAFATSYDGTIIAGYDTGRATIWKAPDYARREFGDFPFSNCCSYARAISRDGAVLVGAGGYGNGGPEPEAVYFTDATDIVGLGSLGPTPSHTHLSEAYGVSGDGNVIVGHASSPKGLQAFQWTKRDGLQGLGNSLDDVFFRHANAVTPDGRIIVGWGGSDVHPTAVRWSEATGAVGLGLMDPADYSSFARGVSENGEVIVGNTFRQVPSGQQGEFAFIWDRINGMISLKELLTKHGAEVDNWELRDATGISADGRVIVGYRGQFGGYDRAFVAILPSPIPEPPIAMLCGIGLIVYLSTRWRTKRSGCDF